jgi:hypothetical protein
MNEKGNTVTGVEYSLLNLRIGQLQKGFALDDTRVIDEDVYFANFLLDSLCNLFEEEIRLDHGMGGCCSRKHLINLRTISQVANIGC